MPQLFGEKLRTLRRSYTMTQIELAKLLGLSSQGHLANLEIGKEAPSLIVVYRAARLFGVSTDYLLRDTMPVNEAVVATTIPDPVSESTPEFGVRLREARLQHKLSQRDLAQQLGLTSRSYISNLEAGRKLPSIELVVQIADLFRASTEYLLEEAVPGEHLC